MSKSMTKNAERKVLAAIQDVVALVNSGQTPTAATVKVAETLGLNRHMVSLVCTGYNTGATNFQREKAKTALEKFANFPIVDQDSVLAALWPTKVLAPNEQKAATAVSDEYSKAPVTLRAEQQYRQAVREYTLPGSTSEKAASHKNLSKPFSAEAAQRELVLLRAKAAQLNDQLLGQLGELADMCKRADISGLNYSADAVYGEAGRYVMNYVNSRNSTKWAAAPPKTRVDWTAKPYSLIPACIKSARELVQARRELRDRTAEVEKEAVAALGHKVANTFFNTPLPEQTDDKLQSGILKKSASFAGGMVVKSLLDQAGASMNKAPAAISADLTAKLSDPMHDMDIRQIQTQAMLYDMLQNDEVISGHDSDAVLTAYNELSQLSPRAAAQPAVVRPWLRKRLTQGGVEPFEAAEMANIEKTLTESQHPKEYKLSHVLRKHSPVLR